MKDQLISKMKAVLGYSQDDPIDPKRLSREYKRFVSVHRHKTPERRMDRPTMVLRVGESYLFKTDQGVFVNGDVIAENECYIIRLDRQHPNLMRIKKGFCYADEVLPLLPFIPPPIEPQNSLQDAPDQPDYR